MTNCQEIQGPQHFTAQQRWFYLEEPIAREGCPDATAICIALNPEDDPGEPGVRAGFVFETDGTVYPASADGPRIIEGPELLSMARGSGATVEGALSMLGLTLVES